MGMRRTRWTRAGRVAGAAAALVGASTLSAVASTGQDAACAPPYLAQYEYATSSSQVTPLQTYPEGAVTPPPLVGASLDVLEQRFDRGPDTDGDGQRDVVDATGDGGVLVTRGDGGVRIAPRPGTIVYTTDQSTGFDLDGDGRDELLLEERPNDSSTETTFLLPGTTAVGSHLVADVGIRVPPGFVWSVGDQIDGPGDDLLVAAGPTSGVITSGDLAMAPGPGGTLAAFEPGSDVIEQGQPVGLLELGDGPPTIALVRQNVGNATVLLWDEGTVTEYRTAIQVGSPSLRVSAYEAGGRRYLEASDSSRSGTSTSIWDLTDPCAVLAEVATPPSTPAAPGADPIAGAPGYTG